MRSSKKLHQMKNLDIDELYKNEQTDCLMKERLNKKKKVQDIDDFRINYSKMRDPEIFQSIVITKDYQETLDSFLENCAITPLRGPNIGSIVYCFKIYNDATKLNWEIKKTLSEFEFLFKSMIKHVYPDPLNLELDKWIPDFTGLRQTEVKNPEETLDILDIFLDKLINQERFTNMSELFNFFELSCIPTSRFIKRFKEGYILKKSGGRHKEGICAKFSSFFCSRWAKRWFMINEDGICYASSPEKNQAFIRETLLFDNSIKLIYGPQNTGSLYGLDIYTNTRKLVLKSISLWNLYEVIESIERAIQKCAYIQINRYMSFAPERKELSYCQWFVDGSNYYKTLHSALMDAENEVFIQDWWLSPEFYFHRPVSKEKNQQTRLDRVFKKLADKGVKIYIIVYKSPFVLTLDSNHTKNTLEELSPNIKVIQHPDEFIFWWTHHEKLVIIDQKIGFLGGLDICHGRMDEQSHPLTDLGPHEYFYPGIDYANSRISDFKNVKNPEASHLNREKIPRMPWHDVGIMVIGLPVKDLARHFMQYWNFIKIDLADRKNLGATFMQTVIDFKGDTDGIRKKKSTTEVGRYQGKTISNVEINITHFKKTKDHFETKTNFIHDNDNSCDIKDSSVQEVPMIFSQKYFTKNDLDEQLKNSKTCLSTKKQIMQSRADSYFISENFNMHFCVMNSLNTLKNTSNATESNKGTNNETKFKELYKTISRRTINYDNYTMKSMKNTHFEEKKKIKEKKEKITELFYEQNMLQMKYDHIKILDLYERYNPSCKCQIVRSASNWSCGLDDELMENSLQYAYIQLIEESKHYIYIENQFFISCLAGPPVQNQIANALLLRIIKANEEKENFKVFVALPLLPGFEGDISDKNSSILRIQLHWQYETISRSKTSLITSLENEGIDPFKYIIFFGLRTSGFLENPVTEIIYIHSKIMIIDDSKVVIGSGNINDRSMMGDRDSEIAIVVEDTDLIFSVMNDEGFRAGRFSLNLRKTLWKEFFEFTETEMMDPLSNELWIKMKEICQKNTEIYRKIFACYPDDNVKRISDLEKFYKVKNLDLYNELKGGIKGFAVEFPLNFLCEENLKFTHLQKEYYAPDHNFT